MTKKSGLCFAVAAVLSLAMATDSQAFWGLRGSGGSCGSSGGSYGGSSGGSWGGSSGGSWGSNGGSHGGILGRIFNRGGSNGSCGSSGGYNGSGGSCGGSNGSSGGSAYYGDGGGYYASSQPRVMYGSVAQAAPVKTQLTLRVPADAKVTLAGVETKQTGELRQFTTSQLADGQAWQNYQVVVEMDRNGKSVREERTITLVGGKAQELSIAVADTKLARLTP